MNSTVADAIALELAELTAAGRVQDPPTGDLGFGIDLACTTDLDPNLAEVDPTSPVAIVQAIIRRFITPRGLEDDQEYGLDVRAHCNRGVTQRDLRALAGALQGEAQKDDRVLRAAVSLVADARARSLTITCMITPADPRVQAFAFTFAVTSSDVLKVTING